MHVMATCQFNLLRVRDQLNTAASNVLPSRSGLSKQTVGLVRTMTGMHPVLSRLTEQLW